MNDDISGWDDKDTRTTAMNDDISGWDDKDTRTTAIATSLSVLLLTIIIATLCVILA